MSNTRTIPNVVIAAVSDVLGNHYYNHTKLRNLFMEAGAPGEEPDGNCVTKCSLWLKRCNEDESVDAIEVLGKVIGLYMDADIEEDTHPDWHKGKERIKAALARHGMSYAGDNRIFGSGTGPATKTLQQLLRANDLPAITTEFDRALTMVESDPGGALTAACAVIEALLKIYIEDEGLEMPSSETVKPLWSTVARHIGFDPGAVADDDMKKILQGLSSIVDGIGSFRTHAGSAHGRGRKVYKVKGRHARLAIHSAHTLTLFTLETWDQRQRRREE